jgi:hypothetical protein
MSSNCFAAGTPILTSTGSKPIEQIRVGDWVLAAPDDDPEASPAPRRVEATFVNRAPVLRLFVGSQTIRTTTEHPFWVRGRGWTPANRLIPGDNLRTHDGRWIAVENVTDKQEEERVHNLSVADYHTYFVGCEDWGFSVWAHNVSRYYQDGTPSGYTGNKTPRLPTEVEPGPPRTDLIWDEQAQRIYRARTYNSEGQRVRDFDFGGRPSDGPYPHYHDWEPNPSGGSPRRAPEPVPFDPTQPLPDPPLMR